MKPARRAARAVKVLATLAKSRSSEAEPEARQRRWIEVNRGALADANAFLERYGLWSDGNRLF